MKDPIRIKGLKKRGFVIFPEDRLTMKLAMLFEGQCKIGVKEAIKKYGYTEQSYYQILKRYEQGGSSAITNLKRGSDKKPVRTKEVENQILRLRFLDPLASTDVLTQKMAQLGYDVSKRSVERTITEYGLKKKLMR